LTVPSTAFDSESRSLENVSGARTERISGSSPFAPCGIECREVAVGAAAIAVDDDSMAVDTVVEGVNVRAGASPAGILVSRELGLGDSLGVGVRVKVIVGSRKLADAASRKLSGPEFRKLSALDSRTPSARGRSCSCRLANSDGLDTRGDSLCDSGSAPAAARPSG
jgi:hypothetical protein